MSCYLLYLDFMNFFFSQAWLDGVPIQSRDFMDHPCMIIIRLVEPFMIVNCENEFSFHPILYLLLWLTYWLIFTPCWIVTLLNLNDELTCTFRVIVSLYLDLVIITQELFLIFSQKSFCFRTRVVKLWLFHSFWIKT